MTAELVNLSRAWSALPGAVTPEGLPAAPDTGPRVPVVKDGLRWVWTARGWGGWVVDLEDRGNGVALLERANRPGVAVYSPGNPKLWMIKRPDDPREYVGTHLAEAVVRACLAAGQAS